MNKLVQIVKGFIDIDTANYCADRMEQRKDVMIWNDGQCTNSWAEYGMNWDLLEGSVDKMEELTGLRLAPTYDYCRIYPVGEILERHSDRPSCQVSVTVCLRNVGEPWAFHWAPRKSTQGLKQGSHALEQGDAIIYAGCELDHWREPNPDNTVYQAFLHYVDLDGPHADCADEYLRHNYVKNLKKRKK